MPYAAVAVCPHPPLLVPELAAGAAAELDPLRAACDEAVRRLLGVSSWVHIVGAGPTTREYAEGGSLAAYGVPVEVAGGGAAPLSLTVGHWLLARAGRVVPTFAASVSGAEPAPPLPAGLNGDGGLLVMGDGSACRSAKAPGALHPAAESFDAGLAAWLAGRAPLDTTGAADVWCAGAPAFQMLERVTRSSRWTRELLHDSAPYGVGYLVAAWARA